MEARSLAGKIRAPLGARFVAHRHHVIELRAALEHLVGGFRGVAGDVDAGLLHHLHHDGVELAGLDASALRFERAAAELVDERFGHLAAGAVVDADEQDFLFHEMDDAG